MTIRILRKPEKTAIEFHFYKIAKGVEEMKKVKLIIKRVVLMFSALFLLKPPLIAQAGGLEGTSLVQGAKKLIADGTMILTGLCAAVVIFVCIKEGYLYFSGEDEEKPKHKKNIKTTIIIGVLIMSCSGLISVIFGYFSVSA